MEWLNDFLVNTAITWGVLVVAMLAAQSIADVDFPPLVGFLWRSALVAALSYPLLLFVRHFGGYGFRVIAAIWLLAFAAFAVILGVVFRWDRLQTVIIALVVWFLRFYVLLALCTANSS